AYTNVLFINDPTTPQMYHLNIWGKRTRAYKHLSEPDKQAYDRIFQYFFYDRHDRHWTEEAFRRLPKLIYSTPMLACAEDLGMIPTCVHPVLKDLNILTLEIQTMPKRGGTRFSNLSENPLYSVDTISTHDMPPLRLWWKQNPEAAADYWHNVLHRTSAVPQLLSAEDCEAIIRCHVRSNSLLTIISLQDWLGMSQTLRSDQLEQEQINHPEIPRHYWRWRMQPTLEQLAADKKLTARIRKMVTDSGRTRK
ncbi:MAG: 4-alpha-glucanotransferase, partial [Bacteroidaceae bacterium]|nr:4-alpha-glucanotransferase [Bacteroidaceae bacterium]